VLAAGPTAARWLRPRTLDEALQILAAERPRVVCGGTDVFVRWSSEYHRSAPGTWLAIDGLDELHTVVAGEETIELGAAVTASQVRAAPELAPFVALREAAAIVGGWQIQNRASLGGNIVNASPAADLVIPLRAYGASVVLASTRGRREVVLGDFIGGPRRVALAPDELVTRVRFPRALASGKQRFFRLDQRSGCDISLVSLAAIVRPARDGSVASASIAVGAAHPFPLALPDADALFAGEPDETVIRAVARRYADAAEPISDVRASAAYRRHLVGGLVERILRSLLTPRSRENIET
jgi:CO/xanthine dehydrogenase FAD-binding subunit